MKVCFFLFIGLFAVASAGWCQRPTPIRLAYASPTITNAPIWIGADLGIFKKYGVDTELTFITSSTTLTQAMVAGEIQFAQMGIGPAIPASLNSGKQFIALFATVDRIAYQLVSLKKVKDVKSLKRWGISRFGSSSDLILRLGLEQLGIALDRGYVAVDERMRTNIDGVFAIGDVTGKLPLAHVASAQGIVAVEHIAGNEPAQLVYEKMPHCTYCQPQVASLGLTEAQARERGIEVKVGAFPYRGNGKAIAMERTDGLVKLVVDASTNEIIGYHMIGQDATELLAEASLGSVLETTPRELGWAVHAHPTLSEIVKEAALAVNGEAIHFWTE